MTDLELKKKVEDELNWEPSVNAAEIGVAVKSGIVTLSGNISSYWQKFSAERAAARVSGVKAVVNELEVRLPTSSERTDEDIARTAVNHLNWAVSVPADRSQVTVSNGWINLAGTVECDYQRAASENAVRHLIAAKVVSNLIEVKPPVSKCAVNA